MEKIQLFTTEGFDRNHVNTVMMNREYRRVTEFEFILLDTALVHLCTTLELSNELLENKRDGQVLNFNKLMVKLLLKLTNLSEPQICVLLIIDRGSLQYIKNKISATLESDEKFMEKYSRLLICIASNEQLIHGNVDTHPNVTLTHRIRELLKNIKT